MTAILSAALLRRLRPACTTLLLAGLAAAASADVPIIHPGPPGAPARELSADEAIAIADSTYSPADVQFMHDMIPHHHQALEMAALVAERTNRPELIDVGTEFYAPGSGRVIAPGASRRCLKIG